MSRSLRSNRNAQLAILIALACLPLCLCAAASNHPNSNTVKIRALLNHGRADDAIAALQEKLTANPQDAEAHNLLCRVYEQEHRWPEAIRECEVAVQQQPDSSEFHLWLGRNEGEEAEHASLFAAFNLARKVHAEFETAVRLDPGNTAALSDLGEYETEAPGFLGGALDKAAAIAQQLQPLDAEKFHELLARIAQKRKDPATTERELKLAIAQAKNSAKAWMNLAAFYARQGNFLIMEQDIQSGLAVDALHDSALVDGASILIRYKRNFPLAETMLRKYLASPNQSEDAPVFQAETMLGNLLAREGNSAAAQQEYAAAKALANGYVAGHH